MQKTITWRKGFWSCTYQLLVQGQLMGSLRRNQRTQSATGQWGERVLRFRTRGWLRLHTDIVDVERNAIIGHIRFNCWWPKATVSINGQNRRWYYRNLWSTKWQMDAPQQQLHYQGYYGNGTICSNEDQAEWLLAGLFIGDYYWQQLALVLAFMLAPLSWIVAT